MSSGEPGAPQVHKGMVVSHMAASLLGLKKASSSALILSFTVDTIPCGAPGMTFKVAPLTSLDDKRAESLIGTI